MAGVINKPDALSLSGNLKPFLLGSGEAISFILKKGDTTLFEQSYEPGPDNMVRIDVKDVVEGQLSYIFDTASDNYAQSSLFADFTAVIDGTNYAFRVIRSGVANLADSASNWLKLHFLTWQPRAKQVTYYSPEWLTYYAVDAVSMICKATFSDKSVTTISLGNCAAGCAYTFNVQFAKIAGLLGNKYPEYYEIYAASGTTKITESQFYVYADVQSDDEQWFLFENSLGGLDTFRAYGSNNLNAEHSHNVAELNDMKEEYRVDTQRKYTKNTGNIDDYSRRWLLDFFPSKAKYVYEDNTIRKIVVTESNATYVSNDLPSAYTFTYQHAEISWLLNLVKNEMTIPDNLTAPDLSAPNFILPPRLAEFPRITLSEGVLFPAFDPDSPQPTVTTFAAIHDTIKNSIVNELADEISKIHINGGSGGDGSGSSIYIIKTDDLTVASDTNVFSAKRTLKEIAGVYKEANKMFLRKDIDDVAHGVITFDKKIGSSVFLEGWDGKGWEVTSAGAGLLDSLRVRSDIYAGNKIGSPTFASGFTGWGIEMDIPSASAEMDNLFVRKKFTAYEIVYSQIYGLGGSQIVSDINKIKSVETLSDRYRCYMDDMDGLMLMNLREGDGVRIQSRTGTTSIKYLVGRCIGVSSDYFDIALQLLEGTDVPATGDFALRWGNETDTDRQGLIYLTTADSGAPFIDVYDGITSVSTEGLLKARLGKVAGIRTKHGDQLSGYGAYLSGIYIEDSTLMTETGETVDQRFTAMNGKFESLIETTRSDMSAESGNLLRNSSFTDNTKYWSSTSTAHFITVGNGFLYLSGYNYIEKNNISDIIKDGSRKVLRILNNSITQINDCMNLAGIDEGENTYSFGFTYKVLRAGTLQAGFTGKSLYAEESLNVTDDYKQYSKVAKWDGTGDFILSFSGEILIYGASLFRDQLADAQIKLQTQITQNAEAIKLSATKEYVDKQDGQVTESLNSSISIQAGKIDAVSSKVTALETASSGWITEDSGNKLWSKTQTVDDLGKRVTTAESSIEQNSTSIKSKVEANKVISAINQTSETITINANRINLTGTVTFSMLSSDTQTKISSAYSTANAASSYANDAWNKADSAESSVNNIPSWAKDNDTLLAAMTGETIIQGGFLNTDLIKVKKIQANNGTIAGFTIDSNHLYNADLKSFIQIYDSNNTWLFVGGGKKGIIDINNFSSGRSGIRIYSSGSSSYGSSTTFSIISEGWHAFVQNSGEGWSSPGLLYAGLFNGYSSLTDYWSIINLSVSLTWQTNSGNTQRWRITHNLGHTNYIPLITPYESAATGSQTSNQCYALITNISSNYFEFTMKNADNRAELSGSSAIIAMFGRNQHLDLFADSELKDMGSVTYYPA